MLAPQGRPRQSVRSLFVSDVHLGCRHAHPELFLEFLKNYRPERLYLVGDIIDWWKLKRSHAWQQIYNDILLHLYDLSRSGTRIVYTPGNHDAFLRAYSWSFPFVTIVDELVVRMADGRKFLVLHGDKFDRVECAASWVSAAAAVGYDTLLSANRLVSRWRRTPPCGQFAFSAAVKRGVKSVVRYISDFERRLADYARQCDCDGVICGHIHTPAETDLDGIAYLNTGDWVENCTAFVEYGSGVLELIRYSEPERAIEPLDAVFLPSEFARREALQSPFDPEMEPERAAVAAG